ncbi:MAG: DUF2971 domain-containing protein [Rhodobacteraceae bacterium]|nr:DUF2971 domain-containing protein [Paracoccaceae bacterium]
MPPKILWKYGHSDRYTSVIDGLVRFTQPGDLNDPFDANPTVDSFVTEKKVNDALDDLFDKQTAREFDKAAISHGVDPELLPSFREAAFEYAKPLILGNGEMVTEMKEALPNTIINNINDKIGIFSLSETNDNILMWSHYADQHRGIAVGFNGHHPFYNQKPPQLDFRLTKISYTAKRPIKPSNFSESYKIFSEKSPGWKYEKEWRVIGRLSNSTTILNADDIFPKHLFQIPLEAIERIVFGMNTPNDTIVGIVTKLYEETVVLRNSMKIPQIRVFKARKHPTLFKVVIEEILK